jgi:dTDP-4-amino-4,6-dideoxygalactose transaminase
MEEARGSHFGREAGRFQQTVDQDASSRPMNKEMRYRFCGPPGADVFQILGYPECNAGLATWFWEAEIAYFYRARSGIWHACEILNLEPGDEVLFPAYYCGSELDPMSKKARIVLYRIDEACRLDAEDIQKQVTARTRAVYVTHFFGFPQDLEPVMDLCRRHNLYLIEDCAHSLFSSKGGVKLGTAGDVAVFSFRKTLPVPDGGGLIINNPVLKNVKMNRMKPGTGIIMRRTMPLLKSSLLTYLSEKANHPGLCEKVSRILNQGRLTKLKLDMLKGEAKPWIKEDMLYHDGLNGRTMSKTTERMLKTFNIGEIVNKRRNNYLLLKSRLAGQWEMPALFKELPEGVCPLNYPILVEDRDAMQVRLYERGIDALPFWKGYHKQAPLDGFPEASYLKDHILALPIHQGLTASQINYIADCVNVIAG